MCALSGVIDPMQGNSDRQAMSRRMFLRAAGVGLVMASGAAAADVAWRTVGQGSAKDLLPAMAEKMTTLGQAPPNVLLITIDTLRADQLGVYGHPYVQTPTLDDFARQGARFDWHMVQQPQTQASHASLFTGMYPASNGVRVHMADKLADRFDTLAKVFSAAGVATAGLFSWAGFNTQYTNFQPGFQIYRDLSGQTGSPDDLSVKGQADRTSDGAIAQLRTLAGNRFFMWLHYIDPHFPYEPPASFRALYDPAYSGPVDDTLNTVDAINQGKLVPEGDDLKRLLTLYQGAVSYVDGQVGRVFQELSNLGMVDNTVVAVTGDHGESFDEHQQFAEGGTFFHPHSLYNTELRVPLLLRAPGRVGAGTVVSAPTQAIDLFPTLLELAGLGIPEQAQGRSLVELLDGRDDGHARAAFAAMPDYIFTSITRPGWKLIRNMPGSRQALFDLAHDPAEQRDLSAAEPSMAGQLLDQLQAWNKSVGIS